MSEDRFRKFCDKPSLKFSKISEFNDPFDAQFIGISDFYSKILFKNKFRKYLCCCDEGNSYNYFMYDIVESVNSKLSSLWLELLNEYRVLCLTNSQKNILMWSHYANNHKGVCVGFDLSDISSCADVEKVIYRKPYIYNIVKIMIEGLDSPKKIIKKKDDINDEEVKKLMEPFLYTKNKIWSYENEYRVLNSSNIIPENGIVEIDRTHVKEVIYGVNNRSLLNCYVPNFEQAIFYKASKKFGEIHCDKIY